MFIFGKSVYLIKENKPEATSLLPPIHVSLGQKRRKTKPPQPPNFKHKAANKDKDIEQARLTQCIITYALVKLMFSLSSLLGTSSLAF